MMRYDRLQYPMETAYGLPEFDSLSYDTEILLKALTGVKNKEKCRALVISSGQGHIPVVLWHYLHPQAVALADRDLLALLCSRFNLAKNGCPEENIRLFHKAGLDIGDQAKFDLITGVLPEENKEALQLTLERAEGLLNSKGSIVISGGSTAITRLETYAQTKKALTIKGRERWRGYSVLVLEKT
jgi:16S rRNA G1207 methylase RsmC